MDKNFFIMGAPNAGKSTYLAALWHSINQNEVPTKLTLKEMTGDSQYLYRLEKKWLEIEVLGRTVPDQEKPELSLLLTDGNDELKLEFPDLSGETFQSIYETREITAELYRKIEQADVILYFINVENIIPAVLIPEISKKLRSTDTPDDNKIIERKPSEDPTQIQIIDLLQIISEIKGEKINLGIIFSAWDLLQDSERNTAPDDYLKDKMNMLWQYIEANAKRFDTKVWGVSAMGGKAEEVDKLLSVDEPVKRIKVINERKEMSHDLTSIILEMSGELYER